jgi:type IV secretory pathway VirJ component
MIVLFSDHTGWGNPEQAAAELLGREGVLVIGVDTPRYVDALSKVAESCHYLVGDAENASHQIQREKSSGAYFTPILAGIGEGGLLAEAILAGAPSNTIAGAISINPASTFDTRFKPCPPDPTIMHDPGLPGFWSIGASSEVPDTIHNLAATLLHLGARVGTQRFADTVPASQMLASLVRPHLGARAPDEEEVSHLPLIELPATHPKGMLGIVISGDGGWRDLDQTIASDLHEQGVSVVGIDSLRYFWRERSPDQTARDVARIIETYSGRWHTRSVALIGYSFGADVMPFIYNRLPTTLQNKVAIVSLLGFAHAADFEVRVMGWFGASPGEGALPTSPEVAKLPPALVQCFYGEDETDTICPSLTKTGAEVVRTSGSHHFDGDYKHLADIILDGWQRRLPPKYTSIAPTP